MKVELPRFVVLKSNYYDKYLQLSKKNEDTILEFSGKEVATPYAKYEVEMAKSGNGLVHIRSCYSNKYWVRSSRESGGWIAAAAKEPDEDRSKWSCTLFQPIYVDADNQTIRLYHAQFREYMPVRSYYGRLLTISSPCTDDSHDAYTVIDWESLVILPKDVAFKGDNGKYLTARWIEGHPYLQFLATDITDGRIGHEVFTTRDGSLLRIKSKSHGKFWRRSPNWIWADSDDTTGKDPDTLFLPINLWGNVVALRNLGNNNYCTRLSKEWKEDCLNADLSTIPSEARLEVVELVMSRKIYNVNYQLNHARIYHKTDLTMASGVAINRTQQPNEVNVKIKYTKTTSCTWNTSISVKLGVNASIHANIPKIGDAGFDISTEFSKQYQWGETKSWTTELETEYKVTVEPMSKMKVSLLATKGSCDVPFSYSCHDTLVNGKHINYSMDDGVYTGGNYFNFHYETSKPEKL